MKIALVISTPPFAWATGGPSRDVYEISLELVKKGHEVAIITTDMYEPNKRWVCSKNPEYINGIKIFRFRYFSRWLAWNHKIFISQNLIMYLRKHLHEYDVVNLHDFLSIQAIATYIYCHKYGVPFVLTAHGSIPKLHEKSGLMWVFKKLGGFKIISNSSKVTAFTHTEVEQYTGIGVNKNKIELIPNGINTVEYGNLPRKGEFRKKHGIDKTDRIILNVGRIEKTKGLDLLLQAHSLVSKKIGNVMLIIVGPDDGYLSYVKKLIENLQIGNKVLFTGPLYERDKLEAYVDAEVLISPRAWEPFGLTLLEACACGTPVICSKGCGIADIIDGRAGLAVQSDEAELSYAICRILNDEVLRRRFGDEGKRLVAESFGWDKIVTKVEEVYTDCLKGTIN